MRLPVFCTFYSVYLFSSFVAAQPVSDILSSPSIITASRDEELILASAAASSTAIPPASATRLPTRPSHNAHVTVTHRPVLQPTYTYQPATPPLSPTPSPTSGSYSPRRRLRQAPVAIAFEVLGGLIGLFFVLSVMRCLYSWKKTPARDRIAILVSRHRLEREMEELAQEPRRRHVWVPPPPPYIAPPPNYDAIVDSPTPSPPRSPRPQFLPPPLALPSAIGQTRM